MNIFELKNLYSKFQISNSFNSFNYLFRLISTESTQVERWATGLNDYWPTIQNGLIELPIEINAIGERINEECKCEDDIINDHLDMLIELLQAYKVPKKVLFFSS
jgi:hypothetical protein